MQRGTGSSGSFTGQPQAFLTPPARRNSWVYPSSPPCPGNGPPHKAHTGSPHTLPWGGPTSPSPHGSPHTLPREWPTSLRPHGVTSRPVWGRAHLTETTRVTSRPAELFTRRLCPWVGHHPGPHGLLLWGESLTWLLINFWLNHIPFSLDHYIAWTCLSSVHYF